MVVERNMTVAAQRETTRDRRSGVIGLTFLLYRCPEDSQKFVAHCLEFDVLAIEETKPGAIDLLKELIEDQVNSAIADNALEKIFRPAPRKYWEMLAHAKPYRPPAQGNRI
jgi:hypothetical protein